MTKKYYRVIIFSFLFSCLCLFSASAQIIRLSQGFDNYIGSVATVPAGWYISWNSTSSPSYYITSGNYGAAIPSYKFGNDGDSIISPYFLSADTLKFWCKGQGAFSAQNSITILYSPDSVNWNFLASEDTILVTGNVLSFPLPCEAHYLMFIYNQVSSNLAFDDVLVTMTDYLPAAVAATTLNLHCEGDSVCFFDVSTMEGCDSIISRMWNFGDGGTSVLQNPCYIYTLPGNYIVTLIVIASNGNSDTTTLSIPVYPLPTAQFTYINTNGTIVDFTDSSSVINGSIISWYWNFGDSTLSLQQHPVHSFPSVGTYYVCLTATSGFGCPAAFCDSVHVIGAGIEDSQEALSQIFIFPNPVQNEFTVHVPGSDKLFPQPEMFDLTGNKISISGEWVREEMFHITIPHIANGVYFLKVALGSGTIMLKVFVAK